MEKTNPKRNRLAVVLKSAEWWRWVNNGPSPKTHVIKLEPIAEWMHAWILWYRWTNLYTHIHINPSHSQSLHFFNTSNASWHYLIPTALSFSHCLMPPPTFSLSLLPFASLYDYLPFLSATGWENRWFWPENVALCAGDCTTVCFICTDSVSMCVCRCPCVYSCIKPKRLL